MKRIINNSIVFFLLVMPVSVFATEPLQPATNTSCNSAMLVCPDHISQSFDNWTSEDPCPPGFITQYYYMYINSPSASFSITSTVGLNMNSFHFYGPLSNNLPDACETYTTNSAALLASNTVPTTNNNYTSSTTLTPGIYLVVLKFNQCQSGTVSFTLKTGIYLCAPEIPCENCVPSFELEPDKKYMLSAWVKEDGAPVTKTSYDQPQIVMSFPSVTTTLPAFTPTGVIIDGWQRIEAEFTVPSGTTDMQLKLEVLSGVAYFDDIRIFPFDGSMKSYVYDPVSLRLVAELDERNYATIYEYDEEGKLVRVKKETERGIMTIQENKTFIKKEGN